MTDTIQICVSNNDINILERLMERSKNRELGIESTNYYYALKHSIEYLKKHKNESADGKEKSTHE